MLIVKIFFFILLSILSGRSHGIMDCIKDWRTHLGQHPYRDYWHLQQYIRFIGLFLAGGLFFDIASYNITLIYFILPAIAFYKLFQNKYYYGHWLNQYVRHAHRLRLFAKDEKFKITTGNAWLDKQLGFHK
jgi:hypothetical protein